MEFYSRDSDFLGSKGELEEIVHEITSIPVDAIRGRSMREFSDEEKMRWAQGRTTKKPEDRAYCLLGIFGVFIPPLYGEGDYAFFRLKDEIRKLHLAQKDAMTSESGNVSRPVDESVPTASQDVNLKERRSMLMASLSFDQMDTRRSTIKKAYRSTCAWLLEHHAYRDWVDPSRFHNHHGFFWISGKAGAGKSTLMKFAHAHALKERQENDIILSFFFNARGEELERMTMGMCRSLLFQLLENAVDLQDVLDEVPLPSQYRNQTPTWTVELLCQLLSAALERLGKRRLICFIDALDECDEEEQIREMIDVFDDIGNTAANTGSQIYMCFASRPYPTIDISFGQRLTLENEQGHAEDVAKYVQSHLRAGNGKSVDEAKTEICERANGVFMWAVLVTDILNKEFRQGRNFVIKTRLREIPAKLSDLFKDILRRDKANMADLLLCLQWILFAKRPLKREEYYFAMVAGLDASGTNLTEFDHEFVHPDTMNRYVVNSSKGLAEITKSKSPTVQFIHESVRDFLLKENGLSELWPEMGKDLRCLSHDQLKRCCQTYLRAYPSRMVPDTMSKASSNELKDFRDRTTWKYPFLEYANWYVLYHADEAARTMPQDDFLEAFPLDKWIKVSNLLERFVVRRHTSNSSLLYICAENNYSRLIRSICRDGPFMGAYGERHHYPLFAAMADGHRDAVRALLQHDEGTGSPDPTAYLASKQTFRPHKSDTPLHWALREGYGDIANILVTCKDLKPEFVDSRRRTALTWAAKVGNASVVHHLLTRKGANLEATDLAGDTALTLASQQGHDTIVQQLLDAGANIEAINDRGSTPLLLAFSRGHDTVVQQLVDRGAIADIDRHKNRTFLLASEAGCGTVVQQMLDRGANLEVVDAYGNTALLIASMHGHATTIQQLLDLGANAETTNPNGSTALILASWGGYAAAVQLLLERGVNFATATPDGTTALIAASRNGHEPVVEKLLAHGVDVNTANQHGNTALMFAAMDGQEKIVQLLLECGADIEPANEDGKTALALAKSKGRKNIAQILGWTHWERTNREKYSLGFLINP